MVLLVLFFVVISIVVASITPHTPNGNDVFQANEPCPISWGLDNPDGWKKMKIDLVSGNLPVIFHVATVTDNIDSCSASFVWICPKVEFDGPFYSYMFTPLDNSDNPVYSAQFSIRQLDDHPGTLAPSHAIDVAAGTLDLGEEMLENVDMALGGTDGDRPQPSNNGSNFVAQVIEQSYQHGDGPNVQFESPLPPGYSSTILNYTGSASVTSSTPTLGSRTSAPNVSVGSSASTTFSTRGTTPHYTAGALSLKRMQNLRGSMIIAFCVGISIL